VMVYDTSQQQISHLVFLALSGCFLLFNMWLFLLWKPSYWSVYV